MSKYFEVQRQINDLASRATASIDQACYFMMAGYKKLKNGKVLNLNTYKGNGRPRATDYVISSKRMK